MKVIIGVGSNLGNKIRNIQNATSAIEQKLKLSAVSSFYYSLPLLPKNHDKSWEKKYINGAIMIEYNEDYESLHLILQEIENKISPNRSKNNWSPRLLDLDILISDAGRYEGYKLKVPHPELANRDFALIPTIELAPDWIHPTLNIKLSDLRKSLNSYYITKKVHIL